MAHQFEGRLRSSRATRDAHEDLGNRAKALECVPAAALCEKAGLVGDAATLPLTGCVDPEGRDKLAKALLKWFKEDLFSWCNTLKCEGCGKATKPTQSAPPLEEERRYLASVVEIHACEDCGIWQRFPRYNDPVKLLETRTGRCGEWANCFALVARAVGFEVRYVSDWTDHVWCELWSELCGRWVHVDPCENAFDAPLMYEQGWGKKLNYIVAFGSDHVVDVTRKYSKDYSANVLGNRTLLAEDKVAALVAKHHKSQSALARQRYPWVDQRTTRERLMLEQFALLEMRSDAELSPAELQGRLTGSAAWRAARGEDGATAPRRR